MIGQPKANIGNKEMGGEVKKAKLNKQTKQNKKKI